MPRIYNAVYSANNFKELIMDFTKQIARKTDELAYIERRLDCAVDDYNQEVFCPSPSGDIAELKTNIDNWARQRAITFAELELYKKKAVHNELFL